MSLLVPKLQHGGTRCRRTGFMIIMEIFPSNLFKHLLYTSCICYSFISVCVAMYGTTQKQLDTRKRVVVGKAWLNL